MLPGGLENGKSTGNSRLIDGDYSPCRRADKLPVKTALTCCGMPCDMCILLDVGLMLYVSWFGEYRPSTTLKCILIKYLFTNKSMQYVRHTLLVVATHCDCSIGRHLDGVVCHYNMIYFNTWMHLRFRVMHIRIRVDGGGTIVYVFTETSYPKRQTNILK